MRIQVKLFAVARQRAGRDCVEVELPSAATARQLRGALVEQYHSLADVVAHSRLAIDNQYAGDETVIRPAAEVALIPPVSGG